MTTARQNPMRLALILCLFLAVIGPAVAGDTALPNLIVNGGFEEWAALDQNVLQREEVRNVDLLPPGRGPTGWVPLRELAKGQARTASIAMDETVKHSGQRSVRIHNGDLRNISLVQYSTESFAAHPNDPHNIKPNHRYVIRWWVKGEGVDAGGAGPILMLYYQTEHNGKPARVDTYEQGELPRGTFDWQQRQFVFITDDHAGHRHRLVRRRRDAGQRRGGTSRDLLISRSGRITP